MPKCGTNKGSPEAKAAWAAQSGLIKQGWKRNDKGYYESPSGQVLSPIQVNQGAGREKRR